MTAKIVIKTPATEGIHHTFGGIYCAKDCGYKCTREQYDAAYEACNIALLQMQADGINRDGQWQGQVYDNCGWKWRITSGGTFGWNLSKDRDGTWYATCYHEIAIPKQIISLGHLTPLGAIRDIITQMNAQIDAIKYERKRLTDGIL